MSQTRPNFGSVSSLAQWLAYIEGIHNKPIDMGLERVRAVAQRMAWNLSAEIFTPLEQTFDNQATSAVHEPIIITVGGTNGKGSTCAILESILLQSGYSVGMYTSPHLIDFEERARINGKNVAPELFCAAFARVESARQDTSLSYFEFTTLGILDVFLGAQLDVMILEVGLGGRLDAVNVLNPSVALVTSVDLDHMEYLGPTREHIGLEKAGIFRPNRPAIVSDPAPPHSLVEYAKKIGADLWLFGHDFNYQGDRQQWSYGGRNTRRSALAYPALRGTNQLLNATAAMAALEALQSCLFVPAQSVRQGLALVDWPGRFQVLPGRPAVVLDVAHNPHAAAHLRANLDQMGFFPFTHAILGMLADKDVAGVVAHLKDKVDHWHLVSTSGARGLSGAELLKIVRQCGVEGESFNWVNAKLPVDAQTSSPAVPERSVQVYENIAEAFFTVYSSVDQNDRIVVFGSFLTVAAVMDARKNIKLGI